MAISGVVMTAKMAAAGRALESRRPDRLFDDPLAQVLAGEDGFRWMEELRPPGSPAENPSIGPRTWFFDQFVTRLGRWPPPGVPDDVADRAAAIGRNWFISAARVR